MRHVRIGLHIFCFLLSTRDIHAAVSEFHSARSLRAMSRLAQPQRRGAC